MLVSFHVASVSRVFLVFDLFILTMLVFLSFFFFFPDDIAHRTIQLLQGLCSSQRNVTARQCRSDSIRSRQQQMSASLIDTVDAFETLLGSMRLGSSSTTSSHFWERDVVSTFHKVFPTLGLHEKMCWVIFFHTPENLIVFFFRYF